MSRRFALILLLSLLTSCATDSSDVPQLGGTPGQRATPAANAPTPVPAAPTKTSATAVSFALNESDIPLYEPLARQFSAANPDIRIVLVPIDDLIGSSDPSGDYSTASIVRRVVSGVDTAAVIFSPAEVYGTPLLRDLRPLLEADAAFNRADYLPGALDQTSAQGGIYALPRTVDLPAIAFNRDLFKKAGLAEPKPDWTFADLLAMAAQLTRANGKTIETYGFADLNNGMTTLIQLLRAGGVDLLKPLGSGQRLDTPAVAAAFTTLRDLAQRGELLLSVAPVAEPAAPIDPLSSIQGGKAALWDAALFTGDKDSGGIAVSVGYAPYPKDLVPLFSRVGETLIMSGGTTHPEAAWRWLSFISRQPSPSQSGPIVAVPVSPRPIDGPYPGQTNPFSSIPARISLAEQAGKLGKGDPAQDALIRAGLTSVPPTDPNLFNLFNAAYSAASGFVADPKANAAKAAADLQQQYEQLTAAAPTPAPKPGPVTVVAAESYEPPTGATLITFLSSDAAGDRRRARLFQKQHPELYVSIRSTWLITDLLTLDRLASSADCFTSDLPPDPTSDALLDLQPLIDSDRQFKLSDYPPALLEPLRGSGGQLFGLPTRMYLRAMGYNAKLLSAAGVKPPEASWTPDDFLKAAQALTSGDGSNKVYGYTPISPESDLFFFIGQFGGRLSSGSGKELRAVFTDPETAAGLRWYLDLELAQKVTPPYFFTYRPGKGERPPEFDPITLVQRGRGALWLDGSVVSPNGPDGNPLPQVSAPLPVGKAGIGQLLGDTGGSLHIARQSKQVQGCWSWLKFLTDQPDYTNGAIPARISQAESSEFAASAAPETIALYKQYKPALTSTQAKPSRPVFSEGFDTYWLFRALDDVRTKGVALDRALSDAEQKTNAFLGCVAKGGDGPVCAKQADPTYDGYMTDGGAKG